MPAAFAGDTGLHPSTYRYTIVPINTAARVDLGKLVALREAQYLARVTEWGVCQ